jgi:lysophosphatidic acid acyltransferase / lysophosphatidylinositol acyltransferase
LIVFPHPRSDTVKPQLNNLLLGNAVTGHLYIRRIPIEDVPDDEEVAAKWLHELYQRKV